MILKDKDFMVSGQYTRPTGRLGGPGDRALLQLLFDQENFWRYRRVQKMPFAHLTPGLDLDIMEIIKK